MINCNYAHQLQNIQCFLYFCGMTEQEFEILFHEQFKPLCNLAFTVVRDLDASKDIVQQVFINLWQLRERTTIKGSVKGYLYRSVVNASLNHLNRAKRHMPLGSQLAESLTENETDEDMKSTHMEVQKAIAGLPPVCQKVFMLSRFSDLTNKEIAMELGVSVKAVEKHISKAFKILRERLKPLIKAELILYLTIAATQFSVFGVGFLTLTMSY